MGDLPRADGNVSGSISYGEIAGQCSVEISPSGSLIELDGEGLQGDLKPQDGRMSELFWRRDFKMANLW